MPTFDLTTQEGLRAACDHLAANPHSRAEKWAADLTKFLGFVRGADLDTRASWEFHEKIWDENPIAATGQGNIAVHLITSEDDFRLWLAKESLRPLPAAREGRLAQLTELYKALVERFEAKEVRVPHLKIFRVLAAFYPECFTTVCDRKALGLLVRRMGRKGGADPVERHFYVRERLDEVLGPSSTAISDLAQRLEIPWYLFDLTERDVPGDQRVSRPGDNPGESVLVPLPAARRRRGLTSIAGGFASVLAALDFIKEGVTRQELMDYLRAQFPTLKENSLGVSINALRGELGVIEVVNGEYVLSNQGELTLQSGDASELGDWLITRVLGVDHFLKFLEPGAKPRAEILSLLQKANPGWTTQFAPNAMVQWLLSMKAIKKLPSGDLDLESLGREWAGRITWVPEFLAKSESEEVPETMQSPGLSKESASLALPSLSDIVSNVTAVGTFSEALIEQLHLGLWGPELRHFAVLAGISGSGKTLLARAYARALQGNSDDGEKRVLIEPVQPGWYDPSHLLGYLSPMGGENYVRTPFLDFLIQASGDPSKPYVLVLDEMNLSRPEQYFAPLLSRMETGGRINLHSEGVMFDGIPSYVPYPKNLAIIGTVNMDETTHGLSDKVLDRAFTVEFWDIDLDAYPRWGKSGLSKANETNVRATLGDLMKALYPAKMHFGWRAVDDVLQYLRAAESMGAKTSFNDLLDSVIFAKLLPKLRGENSDLFRNALQGAATAVEQRGLARSARRLKQLSADLDRIGSAHFWR